MTYSSIESMTANSHFKYFSNWLMLINFILSKVTLELMLMVSDSPQSGSLAFLNTLRKGTLLELQTEVCEDSQLRRRPTLGSVRAVQTFVM